VIEEKKVEIPPNHRRSLSIMAQMTERSINEMEELLQSNASEGVTWSTRRSYSSEERSRILQELKVIRRLNEKMFSELNLQKSESDEQHSVNSKLVLLWADLLDSRSSALRRYGELDKHEAEFIDKHIENILRCVKKLI
jgi:hypothetical protein